MKVIMVTPAYYPIKGGTETTVQSLAINVNKTGIHTDVMTFNMDRKWNSKWKGKTEKIHDVTVFKIPALNWLPIEHSPRITLGINLIPGRFTNILKDYDIIHFHEADLSFPLFSSLIHKPKILHLHGLDVNFYKRYHLSRIILKKVADLYISISKRMKEDLMTLGIPKNKIAYLPNGIDVKLFQPNGAKKGDLILFIGRITFGKGLHILLESLRHIDRPVQLAIIGPAGSNAEYHRHILDLINKENRKGRHKIAYLGALDRASTVKWYQKASIFILPSFREGLPIVLLESLSCETPVIATPVGGVPDVVQHYENGLLVQPNNSVKLAEAIQFLLENKQTRSKLGQKGRECIINFFSLESQVKKLCIIYERLLNA